MLQIVFSIFKLHTSLIKHYYVKDLLGSLASFLFLFFCKALINVMNVCTFEKYQDFIFIFGSKCSKPDILTTLGKNCYIFVGTLIWT